VIKGSTVENDFAILSDKTMSEKSAENFVRRKFYLRKLASPSCFNEKVSDEICQGDENFVR